MQTMRILLNQGDFEFTSEQRLQIERIHQSVEIVEWKGDPEHIALDTRLIDVLIAEDIPANLSEWPQLKFVQLLAAGIDHLRSHPVWDTDIAVCTASGIHGVPMAQFASCSLLMMAHRIPELGAFQATRQWQCEQALEGRVVRGLTVGIVGYGSIGRECARQFSALGMRVVCMKRNPEQRIDTGFNAWPGSGDPEGHIPESWFGPDELNSFLPLCDVLLVTAPSTTATVGMIGQDEIDSMKNGSWVIVVSRGGVVDELALATALHTGKLKGAAIDCFTREPLPESDPLFDAPNVILTPHMSGVYDEYWDMALKLFSDNLCRFIEDRPLLNRASGESGY